MSRAPVAAAGPPLATGPAESPGGPAGDRVLLPVAGVLFLASAAATVRLCSGMSGGMTMPGGWSLSMTWMRMDDRSWGAAGAVFVGTWTLMMVAMMLPALVPVLRCYARRAEGAGASGAGAAALAGAGYFAVWSALGVAVYPAGVALAAALLHSATLARAVPRAAGAALLLAGAFQLTGWKGRLLARCRVGSACAGAAPRRAREGWGHGVRLGAHCALCCAALMATLLVLGAMDLRVMTAVAVAITAERLLPRPGIVRRVAGVLLLAGGAAILARVAGV